MVKVKSCLQYLTEIVQQVFRKDLIVYKCFCFCIYGTFGSLYPYLALYFKQFGLGAHQTGTIIGTRPLVQCLGAPFWAVIADKLKIGRFILVGSIVAWLLKALLILTIKPHNQQCIRIYHNESHNVTFISVENLWEFNDGPDDWIKVPSRKLNDSKPTRLRLDRLTTVEKQQKDKQYPRKSRSQNYGTITESKLHLKLRANEDQVWSKIENSETRKSDVKQLHKRNIILRAAPKYDYRMKKHRGVIGEATENIQSKHRVVTATAEGFNNQVTARVKYVTQVDKQEVQHIFIIFTLIIIIGEFLESPTFTLSDAAMLSQLREKNENYGNVRWFGSIGAAISVLLVGYLAFNSRFELCHIVQHQYMSAFFVYSGFVTAALFTVFGFTFNNSENSSQSSTIRETLFHLFNVADMSFFMAAWFAGTCCGFLVHYVNWYIKDLSGNSVVMGAVGASREIAGAVFFLLEGFIIRRTGTLVAVACGLAVYGISFCIYSLLGNPLLAVILEAINGASYAIVWSAFLHYFSSVGKQLQSPLVIQGILQAVFWGLGNGGGTMIGGTLYHHYGPIITFRLFSVVTVFVLFSFLLFQYLALKKKKSSNQRGYSSIGQLSRDRPSADKCQKSHSLSDEEDIIFDAEDEANKPFQFLNKK